jgi:hypothetical protein
MQASSQSAETVNTTFGDLVEAITQVALKAGETEAEGYALASLALSNLLRRSNSKAQTSLRRGLKQLN